MSFNVRSACLLLLVLCSILPGTSSAAVNPASAVNIAVAAEGFEYQGDWALRSDLKLMALVASDHPATLGHPAATAVQVPADGRYHLWVCTRDFPDDRPGTRTFSVAVGGKRADKTFGKSGKADYTWEDGGWFDIQKGPVLLCLDEARPFARFQGLLLTTDAGRVPIKPVGAAGLKPVEPLALGEQAAEARNVPLHVSSDRPAAALANNCVRIEFLPARREGNASSTVSVRTTIKTANGWIDAGADSEAEGYFAVTADAATKPAYAGFYPKWPRGAGAEEVTVEAGGVSVKTSPGQTSGALWQAGMLHRFTPRRAVQTDNGVRVEFDPSPEGQMEALWQLPPDAASASVTLTFVPALDGQVALGYELFFRRGIESVSEVLLPMMWQRHRLPPRATTLLDNCTPTPIALAQPATPDQQSQRSFAITGEPADVPFEWPDGRHAHFGLSITDDAGRVHPSIWGPVIGTPAAVSKAGQPLRLRFRVLVQPGDWYAGFRTAADQIYGLRDYRSNVGLSLTDSALNMIDLIMDDDHGGWWDRAKAFYQIETKNGGSQAAPMMLLSLYRLTGDEGVYRRRALPTLEFMLSRNGPHFSPEPGDTGPYPAGSMDGPSKLFGTTTYGGLWELTGRRTDALGIIALPDGDVRPTAGYAHTQSFDDWLARYEFTGDKKDLEHACNLADAYIRSQIQTPPARDLGPQPFFYISFVPDWEGLLRLYEVTGRKPYLDAAAFGARQLMTGVWSQPLVPDGPVTIHPGGRFEGDAIHEWWKGAQRYRLGWPPEPGAITEKSLPAWIVSNVGLGFEQPVTFNPSHAARQIYEEAWAPHFLRLFRYTGDPAFQTYARNAAIGRWANYPGYYATGQTDLPLNPRYPLTGPDVTDIYYHHIPAHLAWTIDYLVTEAEVLSEGRIVFPSLRQDGYAYFDSRIFGHAPGRVFDDAQAWLLFRRGLVSLDNVQVNYLTAHSPAGLHIILTNQSQDQQTVIIKLSAEALKLDLAKPIPASLRVGTADAVQVTLDQARTTITMPPRGLAVLTVSGIQLDVPAHQPAEPPRSPHPNSLVSLRDDVALTRAAMVGVRTGHSDAYIWSSASPKEAKSASLHYTTGGAWLTADCPRYPFEFSIPLEDANAHGDASPGKPAFHFRLDLTRPDGTEVKGPEGTLGG